MNTLIERLRTCATSIYLREHVQLFHEAADTIEDLQRENAQLRKKLEAVQMAYGLMHGGSKHE